MKYSALWFLSSCMTVAFIEVGYLHKTPAEALILGMAIGATTTAMEMGIFPRMWRRPASHW